MIAKIQKIVLVHRMKKRGKDILRHARHIRNHNEDIAGKGGLESLTKAEGELAQVMKNADLPAMEAASLSVLSATARISPRKRFAFIRENLEVLVVAIAVAMGIRTYFVQPFKIPTGSMQPSLYGIHGFQMDAPTATDKMPLSIVRWLITGEKYREIRVSQAGRLQVRQQTRKPGLLECKIGPHTYFVPKKNNLQMRRGEMMTTGDVLWRGRQKAGDHVFVNKVAWNFLRPRRGDVMVFSTDGIEALEADFPTDPNGKPISTHYIKRMCGMPNESIGIMPPYILVDGNAINRPSSIARVSSGTDGYGGYRLANYDKPLLRSPKDRIQLGDGQYLALGDNTASSKDSRYWGTVPQQNLVGPAFMVYWPYSKERWGLIPGH